MARPSVLLSDKDFELVDNTGELHYIPHNGWMRDFCSARPFRKHLTHCLTALPPIAMAGIGAYAMLHRQHGWLSHTAHLWLYCGIPTLAAVELGIVVLCYRPQRRHRYLAYLAIGTVLLSCVFFVLWSFIGPALTHALQGLSQPYFF